MSTQSRFNRWSLALSIALLLLAGGHQTASAQFCVGTTTLTAPSGTINDGSGSVNYANNSNCTWIVQPFVTLDSLIIKFSELNTQVNQDSVIVYDGVGTSGTILGSYTGNQTANLPTLVAPSGTFTVRFRTNNATVNTGFTLQYYQCLDLPVLPTISSVGGTTALCATPIVLQASAPGGIGSYRWSTGETTPTISVSTPGVYTLQITTAAQCLGGIDTFVVSDGRPNASLSSSASLVCLNGTTQLNVASNFVFADDFEAQGSVANWGSWSNATQSITCGAIGTQALYFNGPTTPARQATTPALDLTNSATVDFQLKISNTTSTGCEVADVGEDVVLEYSIDGGLTYTLIATYLAGGAANTAYANFTQVNEALPVAAQTTSTIIRWRQLTNSGNNFDNWALDDVQIPSSAASGSYTYAWTPAGQVSNATIANPVGTVSQDTSVFTVAVTDQNTGCVRNKSITVLAYKPTITASGPLTICSTQSLTLTSSPASSYLWNTGATTQSIVVNTAGFYSVDATNSALSCTATSNVVEVIVNNPVAPVITASGSTTICAGSGGSVTLTSSQPFGNTWSNGDTSVSITVNASGNYTVTYEDPITGCDAVSTPTAVTNTSPTVLLTADTNVVCSGSQVQLTTVVSLLGAVDFLDNINTAFFDTLNSATISATCGAVSGTALYFNGTGLRQAMTVPLDLTAAAGINFHLKIANTTATGCETADAGENVVFEYSIDNGATWVNLETYLAGGTANPAYANFTSITVLFPSAAQTASTKLRWRQLSNSGNNFDNWAIDDIALVNNASSTYAFSFSPTTGLSNSAISNPILTMGTTPVTYTVTATDPGGCAGVASFSFTPFTPTFTVAANDTILCNGDSVLMTAQGGGAAYQWNLNGAAIPNANSQTHFAKQAGLYTVDVTNAALNCIATSASRNIQVITPTVPVVTAGGGTTFCGGGSVVLTSSITSDIVWNTGQTTSSITATATGNYFVTYTDPLSGCSATSNVIAVDNLQPNISIVSTDDTLCNGQSTQLTVSAAVTISDDFSSGAVNPLLFSAVTLGTFTTQCAAPNPPSLHFDGNGIRSATSVPFSSVAALVVTFDLKIANSAVTGCETADPNEDVVLEASYDNGVTWSNVATYLAGGAANTAYANFTTVTENVPAGAPGTTTRVRWRQLTNSGTGSDNWDIDNVSIVQGNPSGNFTYAWSPATGLSSTTIANPIASPSTTTTYQVIVTETTQNCADTASITLIAADPALVTSITDSTLCTGGSGTITATAATGASVVIDGPSSQQSTNGTLTFTTSGTYTITANFGGCVETRSYGVTVNPIPTIGAITRTGNNLAVNVSPAGTPLQWFFNGNPIPGANGTTTPIIGGGVYYVAATITSTGCSAQSSTFSNVGFEDVANASFGFNAFPNPFSAVTRVSFDLESAENATLEVMDAAGRLVKTLQGPARLTAGEHSYSFAPEAAGVYHVRLTVGGAQSHLKLVATE